jgi:hypothetical protein
MQIRYRRRIHESKHISVNTYTNELHDALLYKDGDFWKCWLSTFDPRDWTYEQIDGCVDNDVIANNCASHFDDLYKNTNSSRANPLYAEYIDTCQL